MDLSNNSPARNAQRGARAFTLIEMLVVVVIAALLLSLLFVGFNAARSAAKGAADSQAAASLRLGVEQFDTDHGFLPPLVYDGAPLAGGGGAVSRVAPTATEDETGEGPVFEVMTGSVTRNLVSVWDPGRPDDLAVLRQRDDMGEPLFDSSGQGRWSDPRYSKYALAFYLGGALPEEVDGIDGPGMLAPNAAGGFKGVGGTGRDRVESYIPIQNDAIALRPTYLESSEFEEHESRGGVQASGADDGHAFRSALVDRNGRAWRYYRWETGNPERLTTGDTLITTSADYNIPAPLIDPQRWLDFLADPQMYMEDITDGDVSLRSAEGAIVGAGENGVFGTETPEALAAALGEAVPTSNAEELGLRSEARSDNVVETIR